MEPGSQLSNCLNTQSFTLQKISNSLQGAVESKLGQAELIDVIKDVLPSVNLLISMLPEPSSVALLTQPSVSPSSMDSPRATKLDTSNLSKCRALEDDDSRKVSSVSSASLMSSSSSSSRKWDGDSPWYMEKSGICEQLDLVDSWDFNVFKLESEIKGSSLELLAVHIFRQWGLLEKFQIPLPKFRKFLKSVISLYRCGGGGFCAGSGACRSSQHFCCATTRSNRVVLRRGSLSSDRNLVDNWIASASQAKRENSNIDEWSSKHRFGEYVSDDELDDSDVDGSTFLLTKGSFLADLPVPYHNSTHAADVLQGTHVLLKTIADSGMNVKVFGTKSDGSFSDLDVMAVLIAAIVHDLDHPGLTNDFLIKTRNPIALRYNFVSPLENHHASLALRLLFCQQDFSSLGHRKANNLSRTNSLNTDFFVHLNPEDLLQLQRSIVELVLATDLAHHSSIMTSFSARLNDPKLSTSSLPSEVKSHDSSADEEFKRCLLLKVVIKCADASNPIRSPQLYLNWVRRIMSEFYLQGDRERENGMPLTRFFDRTKPEQVAQCQISFILGFIVPTVKTFGLILKPEKAEYLVAAAGKSAQLWEKKKKEIDEKALSMVGSDSVRHCQSFDDIVMDVWKSYIWETGAVASEAEKNELYIQAPDDIDTVWISHQKE